jgi:hypothetical protein
METLGNNTAFAKWSSRPTKASEVGGEPQTFADGPQLLIAFKDFPGQLSALTKLINFIQQQYNLRQLQIMNVYKLGGLTLTEILNLTMQGPDSSTICNLPCFADVVGGSLQDTGISSTDVMTTERADAIAARDDGLGLKDANDSDNPKVAIVGQLLELDIGDTIPTPAVPLTSDVEDLAIPISAQVYIDPDADGWVINSIVAPVGIGNPLSTRVVRLTNKSTLYSFKLGHLVSGDPENLIDTGLGMDATIGPGVTAIIGYDIDEELWRMDT